MYIQTGPHFCIGKNFAYQQMRYAIARLVLTFHMEFPEDFDVASFRGGIRNMRTMFLEKELRIKFTRRTDVDIVALVRD